MTNFPYARQHGGHFPKEMEATSVAPRGTRLILKNSYIQEPCPQVNRRPGQAERAMHEFRTQFELGGTFHSYLTQEQGGSQQKCVAKSAPPILIDNC